MRESYNETDVHPDHLAMAGGHPEDAAEATRQRSARNNEEMRDGNDSRGSPGFESGDERFTSDRDVGDTAAVPEELAEEEAGVLESVPANQDDRPPDAGPPAHAGLDATGAVDELIDRRGAAATGAGEDPSVEDEFGKTVGANAPGGDRAARTVNKDRTQFAEAHDPRRSGGHEPPLADYQRLTVKEIVAKLDHLPPDEVRRVRDYERSHRRRKTLLVNLERRLQRADATKRPDGTESSRSAAHPGRGG